MKTLGYLLFAGYIFIAMFLKPPGNKPFDVFKIHPRLLPYWTKFIGIAWIAFVLIHAYLIRRIPWNENDFLLVGFNFGLIVLCFSKSKQEDEFSTQIRWRAMYLSVISFFTFCGIGGTLKILMPKNDFNGFYYLFMLLNATLIVNIVYYYSTKFWFSRRKV